MTTFSGEVLSPRRRSWSAIAARRAGMPEGGAYFTCPSRNARTPASTMCGGVGKSGWPSSRWTMCRPSLSRRVAAASTSNAPSLVRRPTRSDSCIVFPERQKTKARKAHGRGRCFLASCLTWLQYAANHHDFSCKDRLHRPCELVNREVKLQLNTTCQVEQQTEEYLPGLTTN